MTEIQDLQRRIDLKKQLIDLTTREIWDLEARMQLWAWDNPISAQEMPKELQTKKPPVPSGQPA